MTNHRILWVRSQINDPESGIHLTGECLVKYGRFQRLTIKREIIKQGYLAVEDSNGNMFAVRKED